jgi:hypothetical protein
MPGRCGVGKTAIILLMAVRLIEDPSMSNQWRITDGGTRETRILTARDTILSDNVLCITE